MNSATDNPLIFEDGDGGLRLEDESLAGGDAAKLAGPEELEVTGMEDAELSLIEVPLQFRPVGVWAS